MRGLHFCQTAARRSGQSCAAKSAATNCGLRQEFLRLPCSMRFSFRQVEVSSSRREKGRFIARFDVAILIECESLDAAELLRTHPAYTELVQLIFSAASLVHQITATNVRRIAPVDHSRGGVFLFNYFFADSVDQNLSVWNYTAGWFQAETGLDNSTVLLPIDPQINRNTASSTIAAGTRSVKYCHPSFSRDLFALIFWITLQRIILPPCRFCIAWLDKQARDRVLLKWIPFITRAESLSLGRSASLHAST